MSKLSSNKTLSCSLFCGMHPRAAEKITCAEGLRLANDKEFADLFAQYIRIMSENNLEFIDFRWYLITAAQSFLGDDAPKDFERTMWCALSKSADRYFSGLAKKYKLSEAEKNKLTQDWYEMAKIAWIGHEHKKLDREILIRWCENLSRMVPING